MSNEPDDRPPALVSIHDVMPSTLDDVGQSIDLCQSAEVNRIMLLVVPGHAWESADLQQLRTWCFEGCELAAHGWSHKCQRVSSIYHRLHSLVLSRDVAEHLSLSTQELLVLMMRSANWFVEHNFPRPQLYVPPAWALGKLDSQVLKSLPFEMVETLTRVWLPKVGQHVRLPLVGFEADTVTRQMFLLGMNRSTRFVHRYLQQPLRIAIHPLDHRLRVNGDLRYTLKRPFQFISYSMLLTAARQRSESLPEVP